MGRKEVQYIQDGAQSTRKKDSTKSCPTLATPWTADCQAPLSMGFSHEHWSGLPFFSQGHLPNPGIETTSPTLQVDSLPAELCGKPYTHTRELPIKD